MVKTHLYYLMFYDPKAGGECLMPLRPVPSFCIPFVWLLAYIQGRRGIKVIQSRSKSLIDLVLSIASVVIAFGLLLSDSLYGFLPLGVSIVISSMTIHFQEKYSVYNTNNQTETYE